MMLITLKVVISHKIRFPALAEANIFPSGANVRVEKESG